MNYSRMLRMSNKFIGIPEFYYSDDVAGHEQIGLKVNGIRDKPKIVLVDGERMTRKQIMDKYGVTGYRLGAIIKFYGESINSGVLL